MLRGTSPGSRADTHGTGEHSFTRRGTADPEGPSLTSATTIAVAIATYRRPALLELLLGSLVLAGYADTTSVRVIVVDNDPRGSAASTVDRFAGALRIEYAIETRPGIAAARNQGLQLLRPDDAYIAFVDDDEEVEAGWLETLRDAAERLDADVVGGPVLSVFPDAAPAWLRQEGLIQRSRRATGRYDDLIAATNNTLLSLAYWRAVGSPRFDDSFGLTGGSDTDFFTRLRQLGARAAWCDEAPVSEAVPADRARLGWVLRRRIRGNNVSGRLRLAEVSRLRLAADGLIRTAAGAAGVLGGLLIGRGLRAHHLNVLARGLGWSGAAMGLLIVEYKRPALERATAEQHAEEEQVGA